jgi:dethiobiotin synthetase
MVNKMEKSEEIEMLDKCHKELKTEEKSDIEITKPTEKEEPRFCKKCGKKLIELDTEDEKKNPDGNTHQCKTCDIKIKIVKINDIIFKQELYPRAEVDQEVIDNYSKILEVLPPIIVNKENILIDGKNRLEAHKKEELTDIHCIVEDIPEEKIFERAVVLNATHGKQLTYSEKRDVARRLYNDKNGNHLVKILSVSESCFNNWIRDIREARRELADKDIINDYLKAELTQQEVADKNKTSIRRVNETKQRFYEKINLLIRKKVDVSDEDRETYKDIYTFMPYSSNIWEIYLPNQFLEKDIKTDYDKFYKSLLYYYTEPFDVVYVKKDDGITNACRSFYRRYFVGEDIEVIPQFVLLDGDDYKLKTKIEILKKKMKRGIIAIKVTNLEMDLSVVNLMLKHRFNLENRIILPYAKKVEDEKMQDGYDSILVFSVK